MSDKPDQVRPSELEQLRIENAALKLRLLDAQMQQMQQRRGALEREHALAMNQVFSSRELSPGEYQWVPERGAFLRRAALVEQE